MAEQDPRKSLIIFGRDVAQIPCFRSSFLYGISGGVFTGLGYFMYSSRPALSMHVGFGTFMTTTVAYWCVCRYNYTMARQEMLLLQQALQKKATVEGSMTDRDMDRMAIEKGLDLKSA